MRTSAEFLSDLQPVIDRIAGGPMNNERIDVLASLDFAANLCDALPKGESYTKDLRAARAAVAELIAAAAEARDLLAGWDGLSRNNAANLAAESADRLAAALARIGATP